MTAGGLVVAEAMARLQLRFALPDSVDAQVILVEIVPGGRHEYKIYLKDGRVLTIHDANWPSPQIVATLCALVV